MQLPVGFVCLNHWFIWFVWFILSGLICWYAVFIFVYFSFPGLPVCCRYFNVFWHLSSWLSILFTFPVCKHFPVGFVCLNHWFMWFFWFTWSGLICWCAVFILCLLFISVAVAKKLWLLICFAGLLPVFSWFLALKWLNINTIHFCTFACNCRLVAFAGVCKVSNTFGSVGHRNWCMSCFEKWSADIMIGGLKGIG